MTEENKSGLWEFIKFVVIAVLIVVPIRLWVAQPFIVNGASMEPTFQTGDYLIVDELSYQFRQPRKEEVIVFRYPLDPSIFYIKRVIGVPGETIILDGKEIEIGEKEYFVMGDNRPASYDSRRWGTVPENLIVGRALIQLWPFSEAEILPGFKNYTIK